MQPFTVVLGFVTGSLVSIAFGLAVVLFVFWSLRGEHPQFAAELPELIRASIIFLSLATVAAASFLGTVRARRWRYGPLTVLWLGLLGAGWYYWPN